MSNDYENKILSAVDILIDNAVSKLNFDKTIEGTIYQIIDAGAGEYKVKYQDSVFTAYSESNDVYKIGTSVYVTIPGNDITKDRIILGTTSKLTTVYTSATSELDKMIPIGSNIINYDGIVGLCSYHTNEVKRYNSSQLNIKEDDINIYKKDANYLMIAANFKTDLDAVQKQGNGNYGMRVVAKYHNEDAGEDYQRTYLLDINSMLGQPYNSTEGTRQYLFFPTNGNDFVGIEYLEVFCVNFPKQDDTVRKDDIFISNFEFYFTDLLSDDEVAGVALRLITPDGSYLTETEMEKRLQATLKIRGVSVDSTKDIEYYWFRQDLTIDVESEFYSPLAGSGWYCLNEKVSDSGGDGENPIGIQNDLAQYVPGSKEIILNDNNCVFYKNIFKCVAVVDDVIITDQIIILNKRNNNIFRIEASEESGFKFKDTFELTLSAYQGDSTEVIDDNEYSCYWAAAADGGNIQKLENVGSVITVNPNIAEKVVTYYLSVIKKDTNVNLGSAEITFVDASSQADYNLVLGNADETFKYNLDGISPTNPQNDPKDRITIQPINFTVYDKNGRDIAPTAADKVGLNVKWYWPVENTMILPNSIFIEDPNKTEWINGVEYYYFEVQNEGQVTFPYSIENRYNISKSNNTIFLKLKLKGTELIASTNFTFVKEGEQGTNGTKYVCRIISEGINDVKQVFGFNDTLLYETNNGTIQAHSGRFSMEAYGRGESIPFSGLGVWKILPNKNKKNFKFNEETNIFERTSEKEQQASIIQNYATIDNLKNFASYSIPLVITNDNNVCYVIDGGWNEVIYDSSGERGSYDTSRGFIVKKYELQNNVWNKVAFSDSVSYAPNWDSSQNGSSSADEEYNIKPPKRLTSDEDNYILISIDNNNYIIYPVDLHYNRYSMAAMNDWDGNNLQINDAENSILTAQIAAGKKENDNSFTGIAIGETFETGNSKDIGLFGYNAGTRTIFADAQTGSFKFGTDSYLHFNASSGNLIGNINRLYLGGATNNDGFLYYDSSNGLVLGRTEVTVGETTSLSTLINGQYNTQIKYDGIYLRYGSATLSKYSGDSINFFNSSGTNIAQFGTTARIGTTTSTHISLTSSGINFWRGSESGSAPFSITSSGIYSKGNQIIDSSGKLITTNIELKSSNSDGFTVRMKDGGLFFYDEVSESAQPLAYIYLDNTAAMPFTLYTDGTLDLLSGGGYIGLGASTVDITGSLDVSSSVSIYGGTYCYGNLYAKNANSSTSDAKPNARITTGESAYRVCITTHENSSARFKQDIDILKNDSSIDPHNLYNLQPRQFKFKEEYLSKNSFYYDKILPGFIAEEVEKIYPVAACYDESGKIESWSSFYIIPPMLALIQEQYKDIEQLKIQIKELKGEK